MSEIVFSLDYQSYSKTNPSAITYPFTKPCFLAWRRRYASYFSAV
jgi:hypothetical protein